MGGVDLLDSFAPLGCLHLLARDYPRCDQSLAPLQAGLQCSQVACERHNEEETVSGPTSILSHPGKNASLLFHCLLYYINWDTCWHVFQLILFQSISGEHNSQHTKDGATIFRQLEPINTECNIKEPSECTEETIPRWWGVTKRGPNQEAICTSPSTHICKWKSTEDVADIALMDSKPPYVASVMFVFAFQRKKLFLGLP